MSSAHTPDRLAEALRANLRKRKERMRAQRETGEPLPSYGADEEGDVPIGQDRPGAWVHTDADQT